MITGSADPDKVNAYIDFIYEKLGDSGLIDKVIEKLGLDTEDKDIDEIAEDLKEKIFGSELTLDAEFDIYNGYLAAAKLTLSGGKTDSAMGLSAVFGKDPALSSEFSLNISGSEHDYNIICANEKGEDIQQNSIELTKDGESSAKLILAYEPEKKSASLDIYSGGKEALCLRSDVDIDSGNILFGNMQVTAAASGKDTLLTGLTCEMRNDMQVEICSTEYKELSELDIGGLVTNIISKAVGSGISSLMNFLGS